MRLTNQRTYFWDQLPEEVCKSHKDVVSSGVGLEHLRRVNTVALGMHVLSATGLTRLEPYSPRYERFQVIVDNSTEQTDAFMANYVNPIDNPRDGLWAPERVIIFGRAILTETARSQSQRVLDALNQHQDRREYIRTSVIMPMIAPPTEERDSMIGWLAPHLWTAMSKFLDGKNDLDADLALGLAVRHMRLQEKAFVDTGINLAIACREFLKNEERRLERIASCDMPASLDVSCETRGANLGAATQAHQKIAEAGFLQKFLPKFMRLTSGHHGSKHSGQERNAGVHATAFAAFARESFD